MNENQVIMSLYQPDIYQLKRVTFSLRCVKFLILNILEFLLQNFLWIYVADFHFKCLPMVAPMMINRQRSFFILSRHFQNWTLRNNWT